MCSCAVKKLLTHSYSNITTLHGGVVTVVPPAERYYVISREILRDFSALLLTVHQISCKVLWHNISLCKLTTYTLPVASPVVFISAGSVCSFIVPDVPVSHIGFRIWTDVLHNRVRLWTSLYCCFFNFFTAAVTWGMLLGLASAPALFVVVAVEVV